MAGFLKKHWSTILLVLILAAGLSLLLYPTVSNWWNSTHASRAIAEYSDAVDQIEDDDLDEMLEEARAFNEKIAARPLSFELSDEDYAEYMSILDITGTGVMGYIQIPSLGVNLPIYHGTDESVLQTAAGHLTGTSFPVGGTSVHAAISGHRGLPSARLFTDLDEMEEGDIFTVTILNETITYQVDQIRIVLPEDTSDLAIVSGEDHCTLITCTPYGVNSHRLLVRGVRIDNIPGYVAVTAEATKIPTLMVAVAVGIPIMFLTLLIMLIILRRRRPEKSEQELLAEISALGKDGSGPGEGTT